MSDASTSTGSAGETSGAGTAGAAQGAGAGTEAQGAAAGSADAAIPPDFDPVRALATIRNQRETEARLERELKEARSALADRDKAGLPETERVATELKEAQERAATSEANYAKLLVRTEATEVATKLGFRNPALAHKLLGNVTGLLTDAGEVATDKLTDALKTELRENPYLGTGGGGDGGGGRGSGAKRGMNDLIRDRAR